MKCRVCSSTSLEIAIDLKEQPWANNFLQAHEVGTEPFYPLRVLHCQNCKTSQLDYTVKKELMFANHTYLSGITRTLSNHFQSVAHYVDRSFFQSKLRDSDTHTTSLQDCTGYLVWMSRNRPLAYPRDLMWRRSTCRRWRRGY